MENTQIDRIKSKITPILKEYAVKKAALFGSVVRGEDHEGSDLDVLVDIQDDASLLEFIGLKQKLEESLNRSVDLVEYEALKPRLRDQVLAEQVAIV